MKILINMISKTIEKNRKAMEKYNRYRNTYRELSMLSDRDLADIGINRGMIEQIAFDHTYNTSH